MATLEEVRAAAKAAGQDHVFTDYWPSLNEEQRKALLAEIKARRLRFAIEIEIDHPALFSLACTRSSGLNPPFTRRTWTLSTSAKLLRPAWTLPVSWAAMAKAHSLCLNHVLILGTREVASAVTRL